MKYSTLSEISSSRSIVDVFGGYNHNIRISDGEFYDMKNLTSTYYPLLSPRNNRGIYSTPENEIATHSYNGLISKDALCYVDGTKLYINDYEVSGLILTDSPKQLVSIGAYIIIMPDKKYVNTKNLTDFGSIESTFPSTSGETVSATYEMCSIDGTVYTGIIMSSNPPDDPSNMDLWIDISSTPHVLKQYSSSSAVWTQIPTCYVKISSPNIAASFKRYDGVKITGIPKKFDQLTDYEGKYSVLYDAYHDPGDTSIERAEGTDDYIVIVGFIDESDTVSSELCLKRDMPLLDFVIESGNRLWGCRYGENANGDVVNEIYASKLGDFKNWNCFMGISTDSYVASCGTDGQWTGAITHLGYPIFFKENYLHKVYGNYPSNYQIQTTECRGVQKGCGKSLAIVNEKLFYKSINGICVYDGSLPSEISQAFGDIRYSEAVGGSHNNKYYVSMKSEEDNKYYLFVFDNTVGLWHKEDNFKANDFCSCGGEIYAIEGTENRIYTLLGSGEKEHDGVKWMAETGIIGTSMPDKKYVSNIIFRMSLDVGSQINISIQYDSSGSWDQVYHATSTRLMSFSIPIKPKRCDHFRIKIEGAGSAKIFSITKTIEQGSDV